MTEWNLDMQTESTRGLYQVEDESEFDVESPGPMVVAFRLVSADIASPFPAQIVLPMPRSATADMTEHLHRLVERLSPEQREGFLGGIGLASPSTNPEDTEELPGSHD